MGNDRNIKLEPIEIKEGRKAQTLQILREAIGRMPETYRPTWYGIFCGQLKYISGYCLGGQFLCLVLSVLLFAGFRKMGMAAPAYLGAASVISSCIGVFLMLELSRSKSRNMMELEQACYLGLKQSWCVKMIVFGCLDLLLLAVLAAVVAGRVPYGLLRASVYLLVPFVSSHALQLMAFTLLRGQRNEYLQMGAAVLAGIASGIPLLLPKLYTEAYFGVWMAALLLAGICLAGEIVGLCRRLEEDGGICLQ